MVGFYFIKTKHQQKALYFCGLHNACNTEWAVKNI